MKKLLECLNLYHSDKCGHEDIDYRRVSDYYGVDYRIINKDNVGDYLESGGENEE